MKGKILGFIITVLVSLLLFFCGTSNKYANEPQEVYQVYLNGDKIGLIKSKEKILNMIDTEQKEIREKYKVDKVYPPDGLDIKKIYTYNDDILKEEDVYNKIKDKEPFMIEGYIAKIVYTEKKIINDDQIIEPGAPVEISMMDKEIMKEALYKTAAAFIGSKELDNYNKNTQEKITDVGSVINSVYFEETITIRKDLISTNDVIFEDSGELSKYLLYGTLEEQKTYITKAGENLDAIADANNLNIEELMIANPQYSKSNILLAAGEKVNVGLISPLISVVYKKTEVKDIEVQYKTTYVDDKNKYTDYKQVTTEGQNGVRRITQNIKYVNGEINNLTIEKTETIKEPINQVITRGIKKYANSGYEFYHSPQSNSDWSWPTISPFVITSRFKWRWGRQHQGIDISGCGRRSPVYAVKEGTVYKVNYNSSLSEGLSIYIDHGNGYVTQYMHLDAILVKEGQSVKREQKIGLLGNTGSSTGPHLHLGVFKGKPYQGGVALDPCASIFKC